MDEQRLDAFHQHEVLHVMHLIQSNFEDFVMQHRFTHSDPELREAALKLSESLGDFYQLVGQRTL